MTAASGALPNFDSLVWPRNMPDWMRSEIEPAELEELPMMAKAAEIAGFGENGSGRLSGPIHQEAGVQPSCVWIVSQQNLCLNFDLVALT